MDCRAASGLSRADRRGEDGSLREQDAANPPLSALESQKRHVETRSTKPGFRSSEAVLVTFW
jgi:hypothetical protein